MTEDSPTLGDDSRPRPNDPSYGPDAVDRARRLLDGLPDRIGPYRVLERLGAGGMGDVYVAEQAVPIRRQVAVKVIKAGMDTRQVVARFEAERQALAMMDHPNIAKVFDAGATDAGLPYFAMELVRGVPITQFADAGKLSTRQRVELLVPVCQAVQHAHQKGVVHRDIKPTNVLVGRADDGRPAPKVIDFGIAKATGPAAAGTAGPMTEVRQLVGTPAYMSPEQADAGGDVDTRADVYSLGVLAYELLTGRLPFDADRLMRAALYEVQRIIRDEDPPRPSTRLSGLGDDALATVATTRGTEPARLGKQLAGDLDWIVMRAMEKDRRRRYDSASDLAADLSRHLAGEPVEAAPPSRAYRARKFVRKHRGPVAAAAATAAALVLGVAGTTAMGVKADRQAGLAQKATIAALDAQHAAQQSAAGEAARAEGESRAREAADLQASAATLSLADQAIAKQSEEEARSWVAACPPSGRTWEWRYARKRADHMLVSPSLLAGFDDVLVPDPTGARLAILTRESIVVWGLGDAAGDLQRAADDRGGVTASPTRSRDPANDVAFHTIKLPFKVPFDSPDGSSGGWPIGLSGLFTGDGKRIVACYQNTARVWDAATGSAVGKVVNPGTAIRAMWANREGTRLAIVGRDERLRVWDVASGGVVGNAQKFTARGDDPARWPIRPDGTVWLSVGARGRVQRRDAVSGDAVGTPVEAGDGVQTVYFTPDGSGYVTASAEATQVWDANDDRLIARLPGRVTSVAFNAGRTRMLTRSTGGDAYLLWDTSAATPDRFRQIGEPLHFGRHHLQQAYFTADGHQICGFTAADDPETFDFYHVLWTQDGVISGCDRSYQELTSNIRDLETFGHGALIVCASVHRQLQLIPSAEFEPSWVEYDGRTASTAVPATTSGVPIARPGLQPRAEVERQADGSVQVRCDGRATTLLASPAGPATAFVVTPDGRRLVVAWAAAERGTRRYTFPGRPTVAFYDLATGVQTGKVIVWLGDGGGDDPPVTSLAFSADGTRLAVTCGTTGAVVLDVRSAAEYRVDCARQAADDGAAHAYAKRLLAGPGDVGDLEGAIRADTSLTPQQEQARLEWLDYELDEIHAGVKRWLDRERLAMATPGDMVAACATNPTIARWSREVATAKAYVREYTPEDECRVAYPVVVEPGGRSAEYERATRLAQDAASRDPNPDVLNTLGLGQYRIGRYEDALSTLHRAIAAPSTERYRYGTGIGLLAKTWAIIAMADARLERWEEAKQALDGARGNVGRDNDGTVALMAEANGIFKQATTRPAAATLPTQ